MLDGLSFGLLSRSEPDLYERCVAGRAVTADGWCRRRDPGAQRPCRRQVVNSAGIQTGHRHYLKLEFTEGHDDEEESIKADILG